MEKTLIKAFFDACRYAKHITDMFQTLPQGIHAHHIYTIGALHSLSHNKGATIADTAAFLGVSRKTAGEYLRDLHRKGLVRKVENAQSSDRRHVRITLTEQGEEYHTQYVEKYYDRMMTIFASINNNDMNITIRTIKQAYYLIKRGCLCAASDE